MAKKLHHVAAMIDEAARREPNPARAIALHNLAAVIDEDRQLADDLGTKMASKLREQSSGVTQ